MVSTMSFKEVFKNKTDISYAGKEKELIFKEINRGMRDPIDRTVFKKTPEERAHIYTLKSKWKASMIECFPDPQKRKLYNNPICK